MTTDPDGRMTGEELTSEAGGMSAIPASSFFSTPQCPIDYYLKAGEGRYLLLLKAGDPFSRDEFLSLCGEKGISKIHFRKDQRQTFFNANIAQLRRMNKAAETPFDWKFVLARILLEEYADELFRTGKEKVAGVVDRGRDIAFAVGEWVQKEERLGPFLLELSEIGTAPHSLAAVSALFSSALSRQFPWSSARTTEALLFAALLSDLGLFLLPAELRALQPGRMNPEQKKEYRKHPELGFELLRDCGARPLNEAILGIVREHHEYCDGTGFPNGLTGNKCAMLSKILSLSWDIVSTAAESLLTPSQAIENIFPETSELLFAKHPELAAKYDRDALLLLFSMHSKNRKRG